MWRGVLCPCCYNWRAEEFPEHKFDDRLQYGLIAQEVERIFPELVKEDDNAEKAINYDGMIPILLEAIQEQQKTIQRLEDQIKQLMN